MYYVMITEHQPLKEYPSILWSGFVDSSIKSKEDVKKEIIEHHHKQGRTVKVVVSSVASSK